MRKETKVIPLSLRKQNKNYYVEITEKCGTFISTFSNKNMMFYYKISKQITAQRLDFSRAWESVFKL